MQNNKNILNLRTGFGSQMRVDLANKNVGGIGGLFAYFDSLAFDDSLHLVCCMNARTPSAHFQLLANEYQKLKEHAKALNLIKPA